ncbi:MAG: LysE family translocator [Kangiellaceae bacterium]|nr:LysE family translocator [Kangiellaceae bacterium]
MIDYTLLAIFIPTFLFVSATPGMCMTLAMTLGMTIGIRRTLWMMAGELIGVALVSILAVIGVASVMLNYPQVFAILKYAGGAYLAYVGFQLWQAKGKMAITSDDNNHSNITALELATQGFVTAIANPKGWAFTVSLLPPFINTELPLVPQLSLLIIIILLSETLFMMLYATGGKSLRRLLQHGNQLKRLNQISGTLMILVGIWLAFG